jgi:hypothetical protein
LGRLEIKRKARQTDIALSQAESGKHYPTVAAADQQNVRCCMQATCMGLDDSTESIQGDGLDLSA